MHEQVCLVFTSFSEHLVCTSSEFSKNRNLPGGILEVINLDPVLLRCYHLRHFFSCHHHQMYYTILNTLLSYNGSWERQSRRPSSSKIVNGIKAL